MQPSSYTMRLNFTKMQGAGNDFVVLDFVSERREVSATFMQALADRHFGIGCDQILVVEKADNPVNDFKYRIFNADGSEVEQCGNGARCFARFVREKGLTDKDTISVETKGGVIILHVMPAGIKVDMGEPKLSPEQIPFKAEKQKKTYTLRINEEAFDIGAVSMGNPHAVYQVKDIQGGEFERLGALFEGHEDFPKKANAGFMQIVDRGHIKLRVFERGVGETLACGTGACAAVVTGVLAGQLDAKVVVDLAGGRLIIEWQGVGHSVFQTGPAEFVFEGTISI